MTKRRKKQLRPLPTLGSKTGKLQANLSKHWQKQIHSNQRKREILHMHLRGTFQNWGEADLAMTEAFQKTEESPWISTPVKVKDKIYLVALKKHTKPDWALFEEKKEDLMKVAEEQLGRQRVQAWTKVLHENAEVKNYISGPADLLNNQTFAYLPFLSSIRTSLAMDFRVSKTPVPTFATASKSTLPFGFKELLSSLTGQYVWKISFVVLNYVGNLIDVVPLLRKVCFQVIKRF